MQTSQIMKDNININKKSPEEKELQIKNSLDEFWSKNKDKLMESDDENNTNENNNNNLSDKKKKKKIRKKIF